MRVGLRMIVEGAMFDTAGADGIGRGSRRRLHGGHSLSRASFELRGMGWMAECHINNRGKMHLVAWRAEGPGRG